MVKGKKSASKQPIGERIELTKTPEALEIVIGQKVERWKESLLVAWLAAWLMCGAAFIYFFFVSGNSSEKIMLAITLGLWSFFAIRIGRVLVWRIRGREIIRIRPGVLEIQHRLLRMRRPQRFDLHLMDKVGPEKVKETNFFASLDNSFWVMGGDRLGFNYRGRRHVFGKQLDEKDVRSLLLVLNKAIPAFRKSAETTD